MHASVQQCVYTTNDLDGDFLLHEEKTFSEDELADAEERNRKWQCNTPVCEARPLSMHELYKVLASLDEQVKRKDTKGNSAPCVDAALSDKQEVVIGLKNDFKVSVDKVAH